jgi:PAS domain S-box-containing protein
VRFGRSAPRPASSTPFPNDVFSPQEIFVSPTRASFAVDASVDASPPCCDERARLLRVGLAVAEISGTLGALEPAALDEGIVRALETYATRLGADAAMVCLFSDDRTEVSIAHGWPAVATNPAGARGLPRDAFAWTLRSICALEALHVPRVEDLPAEAAIERQRAERGGLRSFLHVPLVHRGEAIGFVALGSIASPRTFVEAEIAFSRAFADLVAAALMRRRTSSDWAKLFECMRGLGADSRANIDRLTALAGELVGATCALYNRLEEGNLCSWGRWRTPDDYQAVDEPRGHICADVIARAAPGLVVLRDLGSTPYAQSDPNVGRYDLRTYVGRAVTLEGAAVGSLCVVFQRDFEPSPDQARMLEAIADALSVEEVRRRAHEALTHANAVLAATLDAAADGVLLADPQGNLIRHNGRLADLLGVPRDVAESGDGRAILAAVADALREAERQLAGYYRLCADPDASDFSILRLHDGRVLEVYSIPMRVGGVHAGRVFSYRDVTERKRAQAARALLATAVEQAGEGVIITDRGGAIEYVNPTFERMSGYSLAELRGKSPDVLRSDRDPKEVHDELWRTLRAGAVWSGRLFDKRADGTLFEVDQVIAPVRSPSGAIASYVSILRDVTRERQLEEAVRQSQKMEAIGRLAGGVAHDFNNLLTAIVGAADLIDCALAPDDELRDDVRDIRAAAERATSLTRQLLAFSRRQVLKPRVLDLNAVVVDLDRMLRRLIPESVAIVSERAAKLRPICADPGQIEQVVLNLALNARDAIDATGRGAGRIVITTEHVTFGAQTSVGHDALPAGAYVRLRVADDGCGMDEATRARVFEPFFTTKEVGKGTGLGLSTVYGIVRQSGGAIEVRSRPAGGTTFDAYLPVSEEVRDTRLRTPPGSFVALPRRPGVVLLVEDEPALRAVVARVLRASGYEVVEAADGVEALERARARREDFDAVITDVVMPRMGGRELAERLREERPAVPVLFVSGHVEEASTGGSLPRGAAFLGKPFEPEALRRALLELTARRRAP